MKNGPRQSSEALLGDVPIQAKTATSKMLFCRTTVPTAGCTFEGDRGLPAVSFPSSATQSRIVRPQDVPPASTLQPKRLEGSRERADTVLSEDLHSGVSTLDTPLSTPAAPSASDLAEIVIAWSRLSNEVRAAVTTLVRLSR